MKRFLIAGLVVAGAVLVTASARRDGLVVHEWGTFTTVAGNSGTALEWRPLASANDLPSFVYDLDDLGNGAGVRRRNNVKGALEALVRMETPVLYFYASQDTPVSVKVDFPKGKITEWYP